MVRHWSAGAGRDGDRVRTAGGLRRDRRRSTSLGAIFTASVLVIVVATKVEHGAWIAILGMLVLFVLMKGDPPALRQGRRRARRVERRAKARAAVA